MLCKSLTMLLCLFALLFFSATAFAENIAINMTNFPDDLFRAYISSSFDTNSDGFLSVEEIQAVTQMDCSGRYIQSLQGLQYFPRLFSLICSYNALTELDVSQNTDLEILNCSQSQIRNLDVSHNTKLRELYCHKTPLEALNISCNTALQILNCHQCSLNSLDVSHNTALKQLICASNNLSELNLGNNDELIWINCGNNPLSSIDVSNNPKLIWLSCYKNGLSTLDISTNTALEGLYCFDNQLSSLTLHNNPQIITLRCNNNLFDELDLTKNPSILHVISSGTRTETESVVTYSTDQTFQTFQLQVTDDIPIELVFDKRVLLRPDFILPNSLTTIEADAFSGINVNAVLIPKTVTNIIGNPFTDSKVTTICGYSGTEAQAFANRYGYTFFPITNRYDYFPPFI